MAITCSALALTLAACSRPAEAIERYRTRGQVRSFDGVGADRRVAIHHEALPTFKDREGERAPMGSMPMVFGLAPALQAAPLEPGDKLALTFEVHWETSPTLLITELARLPDTTPLALTSAH